MSESESIQISATNGRLVLSDPSGVLRGKHYSQLCYFGFSYETSSRSFGRSDVELGSTLAKLLPYLSGRRISFSLSKQLESVQLDAESSREELAQAMRSGSLIKNGNALRSEYRDFRRFIGKHIARPLKKHQIKAAMHLLSVRNGANFSVPGSGKTSVALSVFHWLRSRGELDSLFVIGPPSCFAPWRAEYTSVIGREPSWEILAGGNVEERKAKYYTSKDRLCDLYLTTYQTLLRDWEKVRLLFNQTRVRFALVVDEAHYIKQLGGAWAGAVLKIAKYAKVRWVLTGTPFPHTYLDAFNEFDILWPKCSPLTEEDRTNIESSIRRNKSTDAIRLLNKRIGPLFYRVRKRDLGLAPQDFRKPIRIQMNEHERNIYDAILLRIKDLSRDEFVRDCDLRLRLHQGRMMRLRQAVSYGRLVSTAITEYSEDVLQPDASLTSIIQRYDEIESPAKLAALLKLMNDLKGKKVVIWSNFIETLKLISNRLRSAGYRVHLIYGAVPTEFSAIKDELTREMMIAEFTATDSEIDVLVANPAACAESISLHKACSHAIYYDLSYNCGQYLQSTDRIHRVGGSEKRIAHYYFLQYVDTIDEDILRSITRKAANMSAVVDQEYPIYSLDMFSDNDETEAYDRLFKRKARRARRT